MHPRVQRQIHLQDRRNPLFSLCRKKAVIHEVAQYLTQVEQKSLPSFQLVYKKHTLTLDDLSTLADQNWLNDQVVARVQMNELLSRNPVHVLLECNHHVFSFCLRS